MDFVRALFFEFSDVVRAAAYILLVIGAAKALHIDVGPLVTSIVKEAKELLEVRVNTGSINALGLVLILIFGIFLVVADKLSAVLGALSLFLGEGKAKELVSGGAWVAFAAFWIFAFVSVRAVARVETLTIKARQKK